MAHNASRNQRMMTMRILTLNEAGLVAGGRSVQPNLYPGPGSGGYGGGGYGYGGGGSGFYSGVSGGGADGGYIPAIDVTLAPIDIGGFDTTIHIDSTNVGPIQFTSTIDTNNIQNPIMSAETASAIGEAAGAACQAATTKTKLNIFIGAVGCASFGATVGHFLANGTMSNNDWTQIKEGMTAHVSAFGMIP
jgi:hypothetical protein